MEEEIINNNRIIDIDIVKHVIKRIIEKKCGQIYTLILEKKIDNAYSILNELHSILIVICKKEQIAINYDCEFDAYINNMEKTVRYAMKEIDSINEKLQNIRHGIYSAVTSKEDY